MANIGETARNSGNNKILYLKYFGEIVCLKMSNDKFFKLKK